MAAVWGKSRVQEVDDNRNVRDGALAYFYEAGTTTPMTVYSSAALGDVNEHPNPLVADGEGRWPQVFIDDATFSFFRVRVTDSAGVLIYDDDAIPVIGQQAGEGGSETPVDANGLIITGDIILAYSTGSRSGFVRANGRTIGNASSGATERANSDTQPLYEHLWTKDANLTIAGGRGLAATSDFNAGKQLTLPDFRGRSPFGMDDMGNLAAGRISNTYVDAPRTAIALGGAGGEDDIALTGDQTGAHTHAAGTLKADAHKHFTVDQGSVSNDALNATQAIAEQQSAVAGVDSTYNAKLGRGTQTANVGLTSAANVDTISGSTASAGGGQAHENMPPFLLLTLYIRL